MKHGTILLKTYADSRECRCAEKALYQEPAPDFASSVSELNRSNASAFLERRLEPRSAPRHRGDQDVEAGADFSSQGEVQK